MAWYLLFYVWKLLNWGFIVFYIPVFQKTPKTIKGTEIKFLIE